MRTRHACTKIDEVLCALAASNAANPAYRALSTHTPDRHPERHP